jgi:hypothetical protein
VPCGMVDPIVVQELSE